jgi:xanthine dehydrogenase YagS FAD-binding subunit
MSVQYNEAKEIERAYEWLRAYYKKPSRSEVLRATTLAEAVSLLEQYGDEAKIFAGGIDVMGLINSKGHTPGVLVNITPVRKMKHMALNDAGLSIGALTLIRDLEKSPIVRQQYPLLFEAVRSIASPHIRNMATIGGNLCQETRCWYYRRPPDTGISFNCRRKNGEGVCYAVDGENQYHGITGPAPCVSVCPSDLATVFLAMDARLKIEGQDGSRFMGVKELYTNLATTLKPGEVISFVQIPKIAHEAKQRFLKFRRRKTIDFAIASIGAVLHLDENKVVRDARLAMGGVSYRPVRAETAEQILIGEPVTEKVAEKASEAAVSEFHPLSKNAYKVQVVKTLVKRAIMT